MAFPNKPPGLVLITRPVSDSYTLAHKLLSLGYSCLQEPLLTIERLPLDPLIPGCPQACILTSRYGVFALNHYNISFQTPVFTVGKATAKAVSDQGYVNITTGESNAAALTPNLIARLLPQGGPIVHFCAEEIHHDFTSPLTNARLDYRKIIVYRSLTAQTLSANTVKSIETGQIKTILFFSPKTARCFSLLALELKGFLKNLTAICLSKAVARELTLEFKKVIVAADMNEQAMIHALTKE